MRGQYILMFVLKGRSQKVRKPRAFKSLSKALPLISISTLPLDFGHPTLGILSTNLLSSVLSHDLDAGFLNPHANSHCWPGCLIQIPHLVTQINSDFQTHMARLSLLLNSRCKLRGMPPLSFWSRSSVLTEEHSLYTVHL